ncbi:MAG: GNAT family N-acetyltransferase [Actinomycetota bacterium]|nr:GNAT family N-acetyltransferase [Actinomycetota bacterium]
MSANVRAADSSDAAQIAGVHVRSWQVAYRGQLPDEMLDRLDIEARTRSWHQLLTGRTTTVLVASRNGAVIEGFVATGPSRDHDAAPDVGEVYAIYVEPEVWGSGLGSALLDAAVDELSTCYRTATLGVLRSNVRTRRFYEHHGWRPDGSSKVDDRGELQLDEIRYRTELP